MTQFLLSTYWLLFLSGLAGSIGHCAGMCGPVAASVTMNAQPAGWRANLLWQGGRITMYTVIGGVMGAGGMLIADAARLKAVQPVMLIIAGLFMLLSGLSTLGVLRLSSTKLGAGRITFLVSKGLRGLLSMHSPAVSYPLGLLCGLLPCGLSYAAFLSAAALGAQTGHPATGLVTGAGAALSFGLGTVPALFAIGKLATLKSISVRGFFWKVAGSVTAITGIILIIRGVRTL